MDAKEGKVPKLEARKIPYGTRRGESLKKKSRVRDLLHVYRKIATLKGLD